MGLDRRGCVVQPRPRADWRREEPVDKATPFEIWQRPNIGSRVSRTVGEAGIYRLSPSDHALLQSEAGRTRTGW